MKEEPKRAASVEFYEKLLEVRLDGINDEYIRSSTYFNFVVNSQYTIFIGQDFHNTIAKRNGIDHESTLAEGWVAQRIKSPSREVTFKDEYASKGEFEGTSAEFDMFKRAVRNKVLERLTV